MSDNKIVWTRHKTFTRDIDRGKYTEKLAVVVSLSDHHPFPRPSFKMGVLKDRDGEEELFPFINPFLTNMHLGTPTVDDSLLIVAGLMQDAHEWLKDYAANTSADYVDEKREREERDQKRDQAEARQPEVRTTKPAAGPAKRTSRSPGKRVSPDAEPIHSGASVPAE